jgi:hypothetical protein
MRPVIELEYDGFYVRHSGAVRISLRIAIKTPDHENGPRAGDFITSRRAEHELVRYMRMRRRKAQALGKADEGIRRFFSIIVLHTAARDLMQRRRSENALDARLIAADAFVEPRHDFDEIARPRPEIELMAQYSVPGVFAGAG